MANCGNHVGQKRALEMDTVGGQRPLPSPVRVSVSKVDAHSVKSSAIAKPVVDIKKRLLDSTITVQRFSLLSRKCKGLRVGDPPSEVKLLTPQRLQGSASLGCTILCCRCSWQEFDQSHKRRVCQQNTEEHNEHALLREMNSKFAQDCQRDADQIVERACTRKAEVHWILDDVDIEAEAPEVVGYVALLPRIQHDIDPNAPDISSELRARANLTSRHTPLLKQLYVHASRRHQGVATVALHRLLAPHGGVVVEAPTRPVMLALERIGFNFVGAREDVIPLALFVR